MKSEMNQCDKQVETKQKAEDKVANLGENGR